MVGVPETVPVVEPTVTPGGRPVADQVYGAVPPLKVKVRLYGAATFASAGPPSAITRVGAVTVTVTVAGAVVPLALVAV